MNETEAELREKLKAMTAERDQYYQAYNDLRLSNLEGDIIDLKNENAQLKASDAKIIELIRPIQDAQIKANTIYTLFSVNGLLSLIALFKIFIP